MNQQEWANAIGIRLGIVKEIEGHILCDLFLTHMDRAEKKSLSYGRLKKYLHPVNLITRMEVLK